MTSKQAKLLLTSISREHRDSMPIAKQIEVYSAMSVLLPDKEDRETAKHIAWILNEAMKHQLQLFTDMSQNGEYKKAGN